MPYISIPEEVSSLQSYQEYSYVIEQIARRRKLKVSIVRQITFEMEIR